MILSQDHGHGHGVPPDVDEKAAPVVVAATVAARPTSASRTPTRIAQNVAIGVLRRYEGAVSTAHKEPKLKVLLTCN